MPCGQAGLIVVLHLRPSQPRRQAGLRRTRNPRDPAQKETSVVLLLYNASMLENDNTGLPWEFDRASWPLMSKSDKEYERSALKGIISDESKK